MMSENGFEQYDGPMSITAQSLYLKRKGEREEAGGEKRQPKVNSVFSALEELQGQLDGAVQSAEQKKAEIDRRTNREIN